MAEIKVDTEEFRSTRELVRELNAVLQLLEDKHLRKIVITSKGRMKGILLSVEEYSKLLEDKANTSED